LGFNLLFIINY